MINKKTILITGGTGSFGKKFVEVLINNHKPKKIIIYSRDELKQHEMQRIFPGNKKTEIRYFIGDVRDLPRLKLAMRNVDILVHAAALKHVPIAEYNPFEAVKTNIIGAQNIIDASLEANVKKVIALSTDKASSPINLYGATKLTSDKLFIAANNYVGKKDIKFSVVRYGNVMASRGSVIPFFIKEAKKGILPITDKNMTRFNITLDEGVNFVIFCLKQMWGGEIFVPKIPSYKIIDLAKAISPKAKFKYVGIRPGEKLHEEMISASDSLNTIEYSKHFVIVPNSIFLNWNKKSYIKKKKGGKFCRDEFSYNSKSNMKFLSILELQKIIKNHSK
mgnify:FL=1